MLPEAASVSNVGSISLGVSDYHGLPREGPITTTVWGFSSALAVGCIISTVRSINVHE